ncbi:tetratricopeptide repeat protein [Streptomyces europaeiscabiei]|uniref:Tetratricopeptide repeat protein n=1 Tax=Streptomyces europaeiscabiei TaxID=146819 RepID=A0AAJ2ULW8_9ACTN|nr:tetratricopeptide repeat protein [Streptomyces europaeiscabiei]MDX3131385.1 tetratricopeptide repeat protein [Streptomyces europaeiscabiei]
MGDSYTADIAGHPACDVLLAAWRSTGTGQRQALAGGIGVPAPIALRCRYRMLLDPEAPSGPWNPDLTPEAWVRQLRLETEGDNALRAGSFSVALTAYRALLGEETGSKPQLPTVHAHIGLGTMARDRNDIEAAAGHFETAAAVAADSMYRFGRMQALVHWAYMTLWHHSAELALDQFREAAEIADALDDPVFQGNAQLGAAECAERLGDLDRMEQHGKAAYAMFSAVRSTQGRANAAQRLGGWLHRRGRHSEAWEWLDLALAAYQEVRPLSALLPPPLVSALVASGPLDLLIVPAGELWRVPWGALPLGGGLLLGEVARFVVCPSLTIQRQLAARPRGTLCTDSPLDVDVWRSPLVKCHPLNLFQDRRWNLRRLSSAAEARGAICDGRELMVLTGHGRPRAETGHYLELDKDAWLLPGDLLGRRPPRRLALIACWGSAYPGRAPSDPISVATLALAGGSDEVLATVGELGDSVSATRYVEMVLDALPEHTMAAAVHQATRRFLARREHRSLPMHHWAPLIPIGTHRPPGGQQ